jgi:hypothetical protein
MESNTDCDRPEPYGRGENDRDEARLDGQGLADEGLYDQDPYEQDPYDEDEDPYDDEGGYGLDAGGQDAWYNDSASYWRRRFIVLTGGLAIVGGITWGLSALAGPARAIRVNGPHASLAVQETLPPAALGAAAASRPSSSPSAANIPGTSVSPGPSPAVSAASGSVAASGPAPPGSTAAVAASGSPGSSRAVPCSPSAIVLSLFTTQARYGPAQQPQFEVYAVSTAAGGCALPFGASLVRVIVTRHGQVLWDSTACPAIGHAAKTAWFTQGVPQVATLSWNRKASSPGCAGSVPAGASGAVDAVALVDGRSSPVRSFTLTR